MLNIYLIHISSIEIGDIDVYDKVYTSFGKASQDIDTVIQKYIKERGAENNSRTLSKKDFSLKDLNSDKKLLVGGYCFKRKKSSAVIYKKVLCEGRLWNSTKVILIGKIGLSEVNIPVDKRLVRIIRLLSHEIDNSSDDEYDNPSDDDITYEDDNSHEYDYFVPIKVNNHEHGQHVTLIQELKKKLQDRRVSMNIEDPVPNIEPNEEKEKFILDLENTKKILNHVTPPISRKGLGRVVETFDESSELSWDSTDISTEEVIYSSNVTEDREITDEHIKQVIDDILKMPVDVSGPVDIYEYEIGSEYSCSETSEISIHESEVIEKSKSEESKELEEEYEYEYESYEEYEWQVVEYYENCMNSDPVPRKYVDPSITENFSL